MRPARRSSARRFFDVKPFGTARACISVLLVSAAVAATACDKGAKSAQSVTRTIAEENALPGSTDWRIDAPALHGEIAGYAGSASVQRGDELSLYVSTRTAGAAYRLRVYRMGWYGGAGARQIWQDVAARGDAQGWWTPGDGLHDCSSCRVDPSTLLLETHWRPSAKVRINDDWVSGYYLARLDDLDSATSAYVPFVVRDDRSRAAALVQASTNTWQAYNAWGDASTYGSFLNDRTYVKKSRRAYRVSYDRPYDPSINGSRNSGAGELLSWEYNFVRWAESRGYDLTYITDIDVSLRPETLRAHRLFVSLGHDEYWTKLQRDAVDAARDAGVSIAFLGGNEAYWQSRLERSSDGVEARILTVYKDADLDPAAKEQPEAATVLFASANVNRPQSMLSGVAYGSNATPDYQPWRPVATDHWIFEGSGIAAGDEFPGIVGYEYDHEAAEDKRPPGVLLIASSPVDGFLGQDEAVSAIYTAASGATVFTAGTIAWSWGLDDYGHEDIGVFADTRLQRVTANVMDRLSR